MTGDGACFKPGAALEYAEVLRKGANDAVYEVFGFVPENLVRGDVTGDFCLRPSDRIMVFSRDFILNHPMVFVEGVVKNPAGKI